MPQLVRADYQAALPAPTGSGEVSATPRPEPPAATPESLRAARAARILARDSEANSAAPQDQAPAAGQAAPQDQAPAGDAQAAPPTPAAPAAPVQTAPATPAAQAPAPAPAAVGAAEKPQYTGDPISLNLKDVDLKDFFRLTHEISGLNIIVDPNVAGTVTMVLDSVPWDQALDIVLKNNHLDKTLEGNVLRIARLETLAAEQDAIKKLAEAREEAQPLVTVFRPVNYAKAATIATMLKSWVGGGALTRRGNILVDDRANTLIISDIQSQIPVIESIVTKLDKKAKQISIEARIVLATASFQRSLTSVLQLLTSNNSGTTHTASVTGTGASATPTSPPVVTVATNSGFGVFAISNATSRYAIDAAIAAAETKSQAKTISRPTIVTQNNVAGSVQQGSQIPIQTTINNTISITYVAATLQLTVTPQVTQDGNIFLVITVQNASPGPALTSAGPSINTQSANTQVLVPDGGTVVFGGVTVSARSKSATYVPLLGSIPIVCHLFKTSNVQDSDNELLFFVTPKVLAG
jgi:type IV pilus assembly protein PilQ